MSTQRRPRHGESRREYGSTVRSIFEGRCQSFDRDDVQAYQSKAVGCFAADAQMFIETQSISKERKLREVDRKGEVFSL